MQDPSLYSQIKAHVQQQPPQFPEQEHLKCPRCDSTNTKFCYYNNYNLSQPRHFCKSCKRYWTKGGTLRNIPVGGASRKNNKRTTSSSSTKRTTTTTTTVQAVSTSVDESEGKIVNTGQTTETLPLMGENFGGQFGNLMEVNGSFSSLLDSGEGQFGNLLDGSGLNVSEQFGEPGSGQDLDSRVGLESGSSSNINADGFLNIHQW